MRLEGCVRGDITMDLEGRHAFCMFISIGLLPLEMMSADAHLMMSADAHLMMSANAHRCESTQMRVFMRRMTLWGSADFRKLLQISLTRWSRGCASALGIHTRTCESCVGKYYTSNLSETRGHPYDVRDRSLIHDCMCLHLHCPL